MFRKKTQLTTAAMMVALCWIVAVQDADAQCRHSQPIWRGSPIQYLPSFPQGHTYYQPYQPQEYIQPISQPVQSQPVQSQPIQHQPVQQTTVRKPPSVDLARKYTVESKQLFREQNYPMAQRQLNRVVNNAPKDTNAYQFRALNSFAQAKFDAAAADVYDALNLGPTWTRGVLQQLYGSDLSPYENQLAVLKQQVQEKPSMQFHFLLAYHHLVNEQWAEGKIQLQQVLKLKPEEPLSTKLVAAINAKLESTQSEQVTSSK